jgi:photosystem II stability/assembly factor-like uncharacterized protein
LLKINSAGKILWKKTYDGGYSDYGFTVNETRDGGFIIGGFKGDGSTHYGHIWLIKTNTVGDIIWTNQIERSEILESYENVQCTQDGGYICVIRGNVYQSLLIVKLDSFGRTEWTKTYRGHYNSIYVSIRQTSDMGYIIGANTFEDYDICLIKTDDTGDTLWTKKFGRNGRYELMYSLNLTTDNGYIIVGYEVNEGNSGSSLLLIKTDGLGDTSWILRMNNPNYLRTHGISIQQTLDGGYIVAAVLDVTGDIWLIRLAPDPMSIGVKRTGISEDFNLHQNYPNPFNPTTTIEFELPKSSEVSLKIFNLLGEEIATLLSASLLSGTHSVEWDASAIPSGVYLYRLQTGNQVETRKMVLMR